jgi:DNA-binding transcriptional LysR family regulator
MVLRKEGELIEMVSHAARGDGGSIALGMAPLASRTLLAPLMSEMITSLGFHASVTVGGPKKLFPMLLDESAHICVCTGRKPLSHPLFATVPLARFPISLVMRAKHPLARLMKVMPEDLNRYPILHTRSFEGEDDEATAVDGGLHQPPVLAIEDYDILARIAASSDAVWVTSAISAKEWLDEGMLIQVPVGWLAEPPAGHMTAYYLKNRTLSPMSARILERLVALSKQILND